MNPNITPELRARFRRHLANIHADKDWARYHKTHAFFYFEPGALTSPPTYRAWNLAKLDAADGMKLYDPSSPRVGGACTDAKRWVENTSALGLRFAGFADERCRGIDHEGWFTRQDDTSEKLRGAVFLLAGKGRMTRAVPGYVEVGFGEENAAYIDFGDVYELAPSSNGHGDTDFHDVARAADNMAEKAAEEARDYDTAWQAGRECGEKQVEIAELRKEARAIVAAVRRERPTDPVICEALRSQVEDLRESIHDLWEECRKLAAGDADGFCFYPNDELRAAFNEGAECA